MSKYFSQLVIEKQRPKVGPGETTNGSDRNDIVVQSEQTNSRQRSYELEFISKSGLFDIQFYLSQNADIAESGISALEHFFDFGCREGRRPNLYFDPEWYLKQNPDLQETGFHPLMHYASYGDIEGRRPSLIFDPFWYRKQYSLSESGNALSHYLVI
jgi:hypothetical protein